jgi:phage tail sheath protein FI
MAEYLAPGVYVEEVDTGPKPIEGVSTSTAGFIGAAERGMTTGLPQLVTSFADFRREYGSYLGESWGDARYLAYAVKGFFDNGGKRAYIMRVVDDSTDPAIGPQASSLNVADGIVVRLLDDVEHATTARLTSLRGISVGTNVTFRDEVDGAAHEETLIVTGYNEANNSITWAGATIHNYSQEGTRVIIRGAGAPTLQVAARSQGAWGDAIEVRFEYTRPSRSSMVSQVVGALIPLSHTPTFAANGPAEGDTDIDLNAGHGLVTGDTVEFSLNGAEETREITVAGDNISWTDPMTRDFSGGSIRLLTGARAGSTTQINVALELANLLQPNDTLEISGGGNIETVTIDGGWGGASPIDLTGAVTNTYLEDAIITLTSSAIRAGGNTVTLRSTASIYVGALVELDNGQNKEYFTVTAKNGDLLTLSAATANDYGLGHEVRVCEFKMHVRYQSAGENLEITEAFDNLSMNSNVADRYVVNVIRDRSNLVEVTDPGGAVVAFDSPCTPDGSWQHLTAGRDGNPPGDTAYVGIDNGPGTRTGIQAMADIDQVSIIAVPGKSQQPILNALITHCETLKDRFAVIDPTMNLDIQDVQTFRNDYDTKYAALYYPWVTVYDRLTERDLVVPPSGHIVGIYARSDNEYGVHKAPANEVIRSITGLNQSINKGEQDILNPSPMNINVLRDFRSDNRGYRVWGARCITSDSKNKYVNVRRLLIFLEESLDEGTQWAVFRTNDTPLWESLKRSISTFLTSVWRSGGLQGKSAEEAFYVTCDRTTMTQDDIDNGRLIVEIGVALVKPAEYVIIRIMQWEGGSESSEA